MSRRDLLGFGAAACVACCAVPILIATGGIAALGLIGTLVFGLGALVVAAILIAALLAARRRSDTRAPCGMEAPPSGNR